MSNFRCSSCDQLFSGHPILVNGCCLCSDCKNAPLFTIHEIADYIWGWTTALPEGSSEELNRAVLHNAANHLQCDQDGIEAVRSRKKMMEGWNKFCQEYQKFEDEQKRNNNKFGT